jgi:hypothetical protein
VIEPVQGHTVTDGTVVWTYVADTYATAAYGLTDAPTGPLEKIWFEPNLIERKLKLHFLSEKGFDTQNAAREFEVALSTAIGEDSASPVLNPNRPTVGLSPLLGEGSIPITGFGV